MRWRLSSRAIPGAPTQHLGLLWQSQNGEEGCCQSPKPRQASRRVWEEPAQSEEAQGAPKNEGQPAALQHQVAGSHKVQTGMVPA